ncbi:MAG: 8-amino-7-oxononanoate synthase [Planctomycetota bacterium]
MDSLTGAGQLHARLERELGELDAASLRRSLRALPRAGKYVEVNGRRLLNLAGNDYLALAEHPAVVEAAVAATREFGVGSGASRLVAGHLELHERVEAEFAAFKHAEAALLFPTGYAANLGVLTALARPGDLVCQDKLNHASLIDAARACPAEVRTYPHRDLGKLERLLARHHGSSPNDDATRFVVTDAVFSMDGDTADLPALLALADRYDAVLIVDEAHATGVLGPDGSGLAAAQGVAGRVPITVSTASKALGSLGGFVTADRRIIDTLINRARPLIYSTAVSPPQAAAIAAAVQIVQDEPWRRERLASLSQQMRKSLTAAGWPGLEVEDDAATPILPLVVGEAEAAKALQARLEAVDVLGVAIRPPTVAAGTARVRLSLRADLTDDELDTAIDAVGRPTATERKTLHASD